ncbi:MAG: NAD-dependent deacetylase [Gammaproteobacteria bacterium]|nr:NAD-dependent deacetylase [Gammaproteobacteria bacterium]
MVPSDHTRGGPLTEPFHTNDEACRRAAACIASASGLLITAGAGMGVDSGLPDFRGTEGFWRAYPALGAAGMRFEEIASPRTFHADPCLAWGFYGHRLNLYRATQPHAGYELLRAIARHLPDGAFVLTSNVDGQFQKAGFPDDAIYEVHGSIHDLQCLAPCSELVWPGGQYAPAIDAACCRLVSQPPRCGGCGGLARPNVLMFGDDGWIGARAAAQRRRFERWLARTARPVIVELGAGTAIPTVRRIGDTLGAPLIRINIREPQVSQPGHLGIAAGAREALQRIAEALRALAPAFAATRR